MKDARNTEFVLAVSAATRELETAAEFAPDVETEFDTRGIIEDLIDLVNEYMPEEAESDMERARR